MRSLSAQDLLDVWETGQTQTPARRVLSLLAAALPDVPAEQLEALRVGHRDRWLLGVRESLFGSSLACLADCPVCRTAVELHIEAGELRAAAGAGEGAAEPGDPSSDVQTLTLGDAVIRWRPLECRDLLALDAASDLGASRSLLLRRVVVEAQRGGRRLAADALSEAEQAELLAALERADPLARLECGLTCPACGHQWQALFDIAAFLWNEIETVARRLLYEVHALASAYGWREAEILALSQRRRWSYLEMLGA
jgi:hypothetical protein